VYIGEHVAHANHPHIHLVSFVNFLCMVDLYSAPH